MHGKEPTAIPGIRYYTPAGGGEIVARDGKVRIPYGDLPLPLLEEEFLALGGSCPSYDAVGRGIYQVLRHNPDCSFGERYAHILKEAYPHYLAELANHLVMLESKEVDVAYLERKITCLKIFALIEPENAHFPFEIGRLLLERGTSLETLNQSTRSLYRAEEFLLRALELSPEMMAARSLLAEVSYLLGKYDAAGCLWHALVGALPRDEAIKVEERLRRLSEGSVPLVPVVDYLEAAGVAFDCYQQGEWEEAAAILRDVLDDEILGREFPLPDLWYVLGLCCERLAMPRYAEEYLRRAVELDSSHGEARRALENLYR